MGVLSNMGPRYDDWLSYNPDLEYENDNPHAYTVTFRAGAITVIVDVELEDPVYDMDENYTNAKLAALTRLLDDWELDIYPDVDQTIVQVKA